MDSLFTTQKNDLIGRTIGNYQVVKPLGAGAMGEVFMAEHPQIGRRVAIKVLSPILSATEEMAGRFLSEARALERVNHPNIIQIFDFGRLEDGRLYYAMEYLQGTELTELMAPDKSLSLDQVDDMLRQIAGALDVAHQAGIIHRDLKPDNIFVNQTTTGYIPKIIDFGVAKLLEGGLDSANKTTDGMIMGTPLYMSPEQAAGQIDKISARSDIYALGVIVYQMLSGQCPINAPSAALILAKHIMEQPVSLKEVTQGLPESLHPVIMRALSKEPNDRQGSAGEFYQEFHRAIAGVPASSFGGLAAPAAPAVSSSTLGGSASEAIGSAGEDLGDTGTGSKRGVLFAVLAVVLIGLGVGGYLVLRPGEKSTKTSKGDDSAAGAAVMAPMDKPTVVRPMAVPLPVIQLSVKSQVPGLKVAVSLPNGKTLTKETPFTFEAKRGDKVTLSASRKGYLEESKTVFAENGQVVKFELTRKSRRRRRRPPRVVMVMKPRPMERAMRPPPRRRRAIGESTISPY
ncbi:MAG: serine/threonine-protein kinase [bacterium]